jgi:hypothetical protein
MTMRNAVEDMYYHSGVGNNTLIGAVDISLGKPSGNSSNLKPTAISFEKMVSSKGNSNKKKGASNN